MAHVAKVKMAALAPMVGHYAREAERRGYRRENIDQERTALNYVLGAESGDRLAAAVRGRVSDARESHERLAGRALRKDANVLMDWVVTLPRDCPEGMERGFFEAVVDFIRQRYGAENVPGGFVHMDETTPHVHVPVIPEKGGKLLASQVVTRRDLQTFHSDLAAAVDAALGVHVSVELAEDERGERQLSRLDQDEYRAAKAELARIRAETDEARRRLESVQGAERDAQEEKVRLKQEVRGVEGGVRGLEAERVELVGRVGWLQGLADRCREFLRSLRGVRGVGPAGRDGARVLDPSSIAARAAAAAAAKGRRDAPGPSAGPYRRL